MPKHLVAIATALLASACGDPCLLVIGCGDSPRVAVEGRVLTEEAKPVAGATITLVFSSAAGDVDSAKTVTGREGLFSLAVLADATGTGKVTLRVSPAGLPGYSIDSIGCKAVIQWGDACVLNPVLAAPNFPIFHFYHRADPSKPAGNVLVTFRRTGGATLIGPNAGSVQSVTTDATGVGLLFPPGIWASSLEPVVGDLTVHLPPPLGPTVRRNYSIRPNPYFTEHPISAQLTGPSLSYALQFRDSTTGNPISGVVVSFARSSGIPTQPESIIVSSNADGLALVALTPLAMGTVVGDMRLNAPGRAPLDLKSVSLTTFDADSAIILSRWRVGTTGILYADPPSER